MAASMGEVASALPLPQQQEEEEDEEESDLEPPPMEEHFDGVLNDDIIAEALYKLGRSALGTEYVYLNLSLSEVDFSYNQISAMRDLSAYQSLTRLILDHNNIEKIKGLEKCRSLIHLSLAHNRITTINGLKNLPIKTLCLRANQIEKITGLEELRALQRLDLSSNNISSLGGLEEHYLLEVINLEDNQIADLGELEYIEDLPLLRGLNLLNNPVQRNLNVCRCKRRPVHHFSYFYQEHKEYWLLVIFMLLRLTELDNKKITVEEKVAAVNKYDPPPEVVGAKDHMTHVMYSLMQPQRIFDSTLPSLDAPYPMLIFVGPVACGKRELTHRICRQFNNFFRYSPCHTTRAPYFGEENRLDFYFVSQEAFDKMVNMGKFIATYKYSGYYYGLGRETVESIAREGLASCVHLEIEAVRSLKNSYFQPRYILLVPMNKERYEGHLRRKGIFSRPEIEEAITRVDMYIKINQDSPGYFDAIIDTDDLDEAYTKLSLIIKEYLGLEQPSFCDGNLYLDSKPIRGARTPSTGDHRTPTGGETTRLAHPSAPGEFLSSSARNYAARISVHLSTQKTPVEEASLQRRREAAHRALNGKAPSAYAQLFQSDHASTTAAASPRQQLLEPPTRSSLFPGGSNLTQDRSLPPASPDTSSKESCTTTGLSITSSVHAFSMESLSVPSPAPNTRYPEDTNTEHTDIGGIGNGTANTKDIEPLSDSLEKKASRSKSSSRVPQVTNRPGSDTKPVLPPIPSGRKRTKP
ncbi:leucine-rich repeat and guanylate kinase domain-containing protein isoform X3 [Alligator mississippiensis]|uniref:leucine-rich repeat and guanylate kinase domain-containing protein isoform X3 n=1 Tax=Alligator mississippiensis TaxID=8496 RepID=UPI0028775EB0|nr:leucine-rich repeat and guanylate kinase domain-containing protein isoform X3 [Alligator mississippiensis]